MLRTQAENLLRVAYADATLEFRPGQWEAIDRLVNRRRRALVVQRTGWGKSIVYFLAAKLLRDQGGGPTLIVSPLLSLMRNQMEAARRLGIRPSTINSSNTHEWRAVKRDLLADRVDLLFISPERLANDDFVSDILIPIGERIALLVVDEAHCISDWGHDFRPDYRRIVRILRQLPPNIAVLATTATANSRVVADIEGQLGSGLKTQRGALTRESLRLQNLRLSGAAQRLAWLADHLPDLPGSGIVYTLTVRDSERVAQWLQMNGVGAEPYHAAVPGREALEEQLLSNKVKCLVATTALGMGFDKPDLGFVVHYQAPGSVVLYYQQVGRAGRAIAEAVGALMWGDEDDQINAYFRETAFPPEWQIERILKALADSEAGLTLRELEAEVNLRHSQIEKVLKILAVQDSAAVVREASTWYRTPNPFQIDRDRMEHLTHQREQEWEEMKAYMASQDCLMRFLARALDDGEAEVCGKCAPCVGRPHISGTCSRRNLLAAQRFLRRSEMILQAKQQWAVGAFDRYGWSGSAIPVSLRSETGRVLSRWGDSGWGEAVRRGKEEGGFSNELAAGAAEMIRGRWEDASCVRWVTCVPSLRNPALVPGFAKHLARLLNIPFVPVVRKVRETELQKSMQNRYHQCRNLDGAFIVKLSGVHRAGPVLLVDDVCDSGWTLAVVAALLREAGSGPVFPLALADAAAG